MQCGYPQGTNQQTAEEATKGKGKQNASSSFYKYRCEPFPGTPFEQTREPHAVCKCSETPAVLTYAWMDLLENAIKANLAGTLKGVMC